MSEEEMLEKIKELEDRNKLLESELAKKSGNSSNAYTQIRLMIIKKVCDNVPLDKMDGKEFYWTRRKVERKIMRDLKWEMRIRTINDFRDEHIDEARKYIDSYVISEK